jgi:hypothetical protein
MKTQMPFNNEIEKTKKEIKVLTAKLALLKEMENHKTPCEIAYKDWWGDYPELETDSQYDDTRWAGFQAGYHFAYEEKVVEEPEENEWKNVALKFGKKLPVILPYNYDELFPNAWFRWAVFTYDKYMEQRDIECGYTPKSQEKVKKLQEKDWKSVALRFGEKLSGYLSNGYYNFTPEEWFDWVVNTYGKGQQIKDAVRESVKWCEEHPDKDPLDWVKPQTPEQVADGLKEAFREAVKQGVVSSTKPQTLYDVIKDWWSDAFENGCNWDAETCINILLDEISLWLPKEHNTNSYKWNECIRMIREKLR